MCQCPCMLTAKKMQNQEVAVVLSSERDHKCYVCLKKLVYKCFMPHLFKAFTYLQFYKLTEGKSERAVTQADTLMG